MELLKETSRKAEFPIEALLRHRPHTVRLELDGYEPSETAITTSASGGLSKLGSEQVVGQMVTRTANAVTRPTAFIDSIITCMNTTTIRVIAAVIRSDDQMLVGQRPTHKRHGGLWEFPGGKCENGESDTEAIQRELAEELAVDVIAVGQQLYAIQDPGSQFLIAFVPVEVQGQLKCLDHSELRWGTLHELAELPLAPSDRRFVDFLLHGQ